MIRRSTTTVVVALIAFPVGVGSGWAVRRAANGDDRRLETPPVEARIHRPTDWSGPTPPSARLGRPADSDACRASLEQCKNDLLAGERQYETWAAHTEGRPVEWTPATLELAGEETLRDMLQKCPGYEGMMMDCDEYPCVLASSDPDVAKCLDARLITGRTGVVGRIGREKRYWSSILLVGGPTPDPERERNRGEALNRGD